MRRNRLQVGIGGAALSYQRGPWRFAEAARERELSVGVVRPPTEMDFIRRTGHRSRASHPKGQSEAKDPEAKPEAIPTTLPVTVDPSSASIAARR